MNQTPPSALAHLFRTHGPALVLYARQWCETPEDVVQEAFIQLLRLRESCANPVAWLYRVVRNQALNASREGARRRRREEQTTALRPRWFEDSPDAALDARSATQLLQNLSGEQREVIVARLWGGLSFEEIGELAGCSTSSAFRRFQAGLEALRRGLEPVESMRTPNTKQDL
jgi:RNA polymerase sigma factor (sigma-70 family)